MTASFNDAAINYREFFQDVQNIIQKNQDDNHLIFVAGEPMTRGWGYHYIWQIVAIILISLAVIVLIHYYGIRGVARWWAPLMTGSCSALWGMGFTGLIGYQLDPVMLVIPFILTARRRQPRYSVAAALLQRNRTFRGQRSGLGHFDHQPDVTARTGFDSGRHLRHYLCVFQWNSDAASYRADRRRVGGGEPHDGVCVPADRDELSDPRPNSKS